MQYTDSGGDGEPLVLLHAGVFADWFGPLERQPEIAGLRRIHVTRTGYADPPPVSPLTVADHAAECADLLRTLGIGRARLLAHSAGVVFALQLAIDHPDVVGHLTLVEPPFIDPLVAPQDRAAVDAMLGPMIGAAMAAAMAGDLGTAFTTFMTALCGPDHRSVLAEALGTDGLEQAERDCGYFFTGEVPAVGQWRFDAELANRIQQPVRLVAGGDSPAFMHRLVQHLAGMLPNAEPTVTVPGGDHLLPLRAPGTLARLLPTSAAVT